MSKPASRYEVVKCDPGFKALQKAVGEISEKGYRIVSVVADHGGAFASNTGIIYGFLIVIEKLDPQ